MIGKKVKVKTNSRYPEVLTVIDKVRGVYVHTPVDENKIAIEGTTSKVVTIDYYLCKQEDGRVIHVKPTSIEQVLEEDKRPEVTY